VKSNVFRLSTGRPRLAPVTAAIAVGIASALALSACSGSSSGTETTSAADADYGTIDIQLSYLKNTEFAGNFIADDKGYYADAGFPEVTLTAGGSVATSAEAQVATGASLIGISSPMITAPAVLKGAEIKIIAADYQKNPFDIVSLEAAPLESPADLKGKTIAVSDFNINVWNAFLGANDLAEGDVTTVPWSDGPGQLASGQIDGYLGYTTGFTGAVGTDKQPAVEFLLADEGLPMVSEVVLASQDTIDNNRDELKAVLKATILGWKDAIADPEAATTLTVDVYGKDQDFDYDSQFAAITKQETLMVTSDTDANGLLTITPELVDQSITALNLAGIDITADQLFDTSVIDEVYEENPDLK
jgi:ABC-type nitrate/sulfonate/bicarbonate transport system substrate-binding protein